jgi:xanthine dehydrogenase accessory factor
MFDIVGSVDRWLHEGYAVALATVVETWGSSPRQAGAKMALTNATAMSGSVSGGCVESAVAEEAIKTLSTGRPRLLHFGVSDDTAWGVGLACGGKLWVFVEPLDRSWWEQVSACIRAQRAAVTITVLQGDLAGEKMLVGSAGEIRYITSRLDAGEGIASALAESAAVNGGNTRRQEVAGLDVLIDLHHRQPRLIIIGGAHVALALHNFAHQLGFRVVLIDPRRAFSTPERFPNAESILHSYPDKALPQVGIDADTYIAVLTHDPKIDDPALQTALPSPARYIGVLSGRRTHRQRVRRLVEKGIDPALLERIHTPIGLPIQAQTPEEIALCIMAEIVAIRNGAAS